MSKHNGTGEGVLQSQIMELIKRELKVVDGVLTLQSHFFDDLRADSLAIVRLIMIIEDEFDIQIPLEDVEGISTVGDAVAYVRGRVQA